MKRLKYSELPKEVADVLKETHATCNFNFVSRREYGYIKEHQGVVYIIKMNNVLLQFPEFIKTEEQALELLQLFDIVYEEGINTKLRTARRNNEKI